MDAIPIRLNQIGTLTQKHDVAQTARERGWVAVVSHRGGENRKTAPLADCVEGEGRPDARHRDGPVLRDELRQTGGQPEAVAGVLADTVRRIAETNAAVGSRLLIGSLPRAAVPVDDISISLGHLDWTRGQFPYLPSESDEVVGWGPNAVCDGSAMTGVQYSGGTPLPAWNA